MEKATAKRLRHRPNGEYEEIGRIDWTWCGENTKLTHFISSSSTKELWGEGWFQMSKLPGNSK